MTDRELLELAAKAIGRTVEPDINGWNNKYPLGWAPLDDDGDALRLAVKLGIVIYPPECEDDDPTVNGPGDNAAWITEPRNDNPYAATRRAIVKAAAEIGKAMP